MRTLSLTNGTRGTRPPSLLVASGKGGVGTSCVAALVALAAAARGERVLLVDATESAGAQHQLFGVRPSHSVWMLADSRVRTEHALVDLDDNLSLVPGGTSGGAVTPSNDHERRTALTRLTQISSNYQFIVFDGGSRLDTVTAISEIADPSLVLVTSADRLALAANYALVKSVCSRRPDAIVSVVANRHGESVANEACEFLVGACRHFLNRAIDVAGFIPDDPCLQAAVGAGMSIHDACDGSPAAGAIRGLVTRFIPTWPADPMQQGQAAPIGTVSSPPSRRWS